MSVRIPLVYQTADPVPLVVFPKGSVCHIPAVWSGPVIVSARCGRSGVPSEPVLSKPICEKCARHWEKWRGAGK